MKKCLLLLALTSSLFLSCKKEDAQKLSAQKTAELMQKDPDVSRLLYAYAAPQAEREKLGQQIVDRYKLDAYSGPELQMIIQSTFQKILWKPGTVTMAMLKGVSEAAPDPNADPMLLPPVSKDCWKDLIEDQSACSKAVVVKSLILLPTIAANTFFYLLAQATIFYEHSQCIDASNRNYRRCMEKTVLAVDPNSLIEPEPQLLPYYDLYPIFEIAPTPQSIYP